MSGTAVVLVASGLLLLGVVASRVSSRLGVPAVLVFLALGMLGGSDGPGGIDFDNAELAQTLGVVALALILFSGGISTSWVDQTAAAMMASSSSRGGPSVGAGGRSSFVA